MKRNDALRHKKSSPLSRLAACVLSAALLVGVFSGSAQGAEAEEVLLTPLPTESDITLEEAEEGAEPADEPEEETVEVQSAEVALQAEEASWSTVSEVLNTTDHKAYVSGYQSGLFLPNASITRAEAVQMFYSLLIEKEQPRKNFTDTNNAWYTDAVETVAGMGVLNGYSDGTFVPKKKITRAEFVTIAVKFDSLTEGELTFTDVPEDYWATPYIVSAAEKGWVSGKSEGKFCPKDPITRAEAVTILNKLLGRVPDTDILQKTDAKNFYDVFPEHWAYGQILEAATNHEYYHDSTGERWLSYEQDFSKATSGWITENGQKYYVNAAKRKVVRGQQTIDGVTYTFHEKTGVLSSGWVMKDGYRRYYHNGTLSEDISKLGLVSGPYLIKVYKPANYLIVFAKDSTGQYNTPVKAMRVSCGQATPTGTFYTPERYRWLRMVGDTWAQWCTQIEGNYLFHSVPNWTKNNADLEVEEFNYLGETRSLGCIRLNCADAKWIYDNCILGTKVVISASETAGPLAKPAGIQIPAWHTWDPTDPTATGYCKAHGCH